MFNIGFSEALIIFFVALVVLGPERLPEVGRFLGKLSLEFKKAIDELKKELEIEELEQEVEEAKEEAKKVLDSEIEPLKDPLKLLEEYKTQDGSSLSNYDKNSRKA
ncbi:MAG: Sec-independent protein translocase protein TatB [Caldimicrobium sp.]|jgi:sec-independent protein translocase protein TatB|nr:Sec-independent protein translocase protein TatB [Caldimicrobium sp.]